MHITDQFVKNSMKKTLSEDRKTMTEYVVSWDPHQSNEEKAASEIARNATWKKKFMQNDMSLYFLM